MFCNVFASANIPRHNDGIRNPSAGWKTNSPSERTRLVVIRGRMEVSTSMTQDSRSAYLCLLVAAGQPMRYTRTSLVIAIAQSTDGMSERVSGMSPIAARFEFRCSDVLGMHTRNLHRQGPIAEILYRWTPLTQDVRTYIRSLQRQASRQPHYSPYIPTPPPIPTTTNQSRSHISHHVPSHPHRPL